MGNWNSNDHALTHIFFDPELTIRNQIGMCETLDICMHRFTQDWPCVSTKTKGEVLLKPDNTHYLCKG